MSSAGAQLAAIQGLISAYRLQLNEKREELRRLKKALSELGMNKSDFMESKGMCLKPEITAKTFHGENADDLDGFREDGLQASFVAIHNEQISAAEGKISARIAIVKQEIASLENTISSLEAQLAALSAL
ncbi:YwqH-like family protein [Lentibacillus sp. Marseille-P4043]|uniref:YwqH-like family protein n=1 Tax=Lentibacillus sp. Marseille-P4043 TaxID=2040293 RepID=UPI000D0AF2CB|nr:DUF5082 family protein [Lentibacillus sp. Marseille-P4043]